MVEKMQEVALHSERWRIPALKFILRQTLTTEVKKANAILDKTTTKSITQSNEPFYVTGVVFTERLGVMISRKCEKKEPMWKRRLEEQMLG